MALPKSAIRTAAGGSRWPACVSLHRLARSRPPQTDTVALQQSPCGTRSLRSRAGVQACARRRRAAVKASFSIRPRNSGDCLISSGRPAVSGQNAHGFPDMVFAQNPRCANAVHQARECCLRGHSFERTCGCGTLCRYRDHVSASDQKDNNTGKRRKIAAAFKTAVRRARRCLREGIEASRPRAAGPPDFKR